jgi:hypothetical protein
MDEPPDRAELREALRYACAAARRLPQVVGTPKLPTRWDRAHSHLNDLLDQLVGR